MYREEEIARGSAYNAINFHRHWHKNGSSLRPSKAQYLLCIIVVVIITNIIISISSEIPAFVYRLRIINAKEGLLYSVLSWQRKSLQSVRTSGSWIERLCHAKEISNQPTMLVDTLLRQRDSPLQTKDTRINCWNGHELWTLENMIVTDLFVAHGIRHCHSHSHNEIY